MWHEDGDINDKAFYWLIQQAETLQKIRTEADDLYNEEIDLMDFGERVVNIL